MPSPPFLDPDSRARRAILPPAAVVMLLVLVLLPALAARSVSAAKAALGSAHPRASSTTFYVDRYGSDWNRGTSPGLSWRTVSRVNQARLRPGDKVLFKGGETFADDTLMPGWGTGVSGSRAAPVVFGSYGRRNATITNGIWINGETNLVFENFNLGPGQGVSGTGDSIAIQYSSIRNITGGNAEFGIVVNGSGWRITNNTIDHTGDSGMLLQGDHYTVSGNAITNTGVDPKITWGAHGIYLKASHSTITNNNITNFHNDGISVRYRNSTITKNHIDGGEIGIAWFQYDNTHGTSHFLQNTITATTSAGIFVCGVAESCPQPLESFVIEHNRLQHTRGDHLNLQPTLGVYKVRNNR